jgi:hypothetical protein
LPVLIASGTPVTTCSAGPPRRVAASSWTSSTISEPVCSASIASGIAAGIGPRPPASCQAIVARRARSSLPGRRA